MLSYKTKGKKSLPAAAPLSGFFGASSPVAQMMVFINGLALTLVAFFTLNMFVAQAVRESYARSASDVAQSVLSVFSDMEGALYATASLAAHLDVDRFPDLYNSLQKIVPETALFKDLVWVRPGADGRWVVQRLKGRGGEPPAFQEWFADVDAMGRWISSVVPGASRTPVLLKDLPGVRDDMRSHMASFSLRPFLFAMPVGAGAAEKGFVAGSVWLNSFPGGAERSVSVLSLVIEDRADSVPLFSYRSSREGQGASAFSSVQTFRSGMRTLGLSVEIEEGEREGVFRQVPFIVLAFGAILTLVGTLYVRGNQVQALRLQAVNDVLEKKNRELGMEISRRERLNEALARAERENRAVIDSVSDIIFEIGQTGEILFLSAAWERVTGAEVSGFIGTNLIGLLHPQDQDDQRVALRRIVADEARGDQDLRAFARLRSADGTFRTVELALSMVRKDRNGSLRIVGTMTDVEERRRAERALGEAERKYRMIVENAAGGIYQMTLEGQYLSANPAMARIFGYDSPEHLLRDVTNAPRQIYAGAREYLEFLRLAGQGTQMRSMEIEARRRDGSRIWVFENMRAVRDEGGAVLYFEGSIEDVTARKTAEIALREAKIQSDLANRAKSEFLANMSHELRTPLNAIIGFSEIIKKEAFGPVGQQVYWEYASDIYESGKRLLGVINQILDVSRIEAGERRLNEGIVDIEKVVGECLTLLGSRIEAASLSLENRVEGRVPRLIGEEIAIKQMLMNLMTNAVKFTAPGGRITLDADMGADGRLRLTVTDTGIGLDEEEIRKALSGFGAVDGAHSRSHTGAGLGLTLVAALIRLHGGVLEIVSRKGIGTAATLVFPAKRVAAADPVARTKTPRIVEFPAKTEKPEGREPSSPEAPESALLPGDPSA